MQPVPEHGVTPSGFAQKAGAQHGWPASQAPPMLPHPDGPQTQLACVQLWLVYGFRQ